MCMISTVLKGMRNRFVLYRSCMTFKGEFDGLDLTAATLNTILKYTYPSSHKKTEEITSKKVGYFFAEEEAFKTVTEITGAGTSRHPLTFILEAADDIAYLVAAGRCDWERRDFF